MIHDPALWLFRRFYVLWRTGKGDLHLMCYLLNYLGSISIVLDCSSISRGSLGFGA